MTSTRNIPIKTKIAILTINAGKIREVTFYGLSTNCAIVTLQLTITDVL